MSSGSIIGAGLGRRGSKIQWGTAGKIVIAWFITLPAAGAVGAVCEFIARAGTPGLVIDALIGAAVIVLIFVLSRQKPAEQSNALEVDVAMNSVFTRKERRALQKKRSDEMLEARRQMSDESSLFELGAEEEAR